MSENTAFVGSVNYPLPYVDAKGSIKLLSNDETYIRLPVLLEGTPEEIQNRVTGTLWRHLPTRGRLKSFLADLRRRSSNIDADLSVQKAFKHRRRAKLTLGLPGSGKTHKAHTLGKMVSDKGAIYVNCKDMDLKSLIVQTVLDTSNIDVEKNAIDARIKMYNKGDKTALTPEGIDLLKKMFEDAFTIDDQGYISLDWEAARNNTAYTSHDRDREFVSLLQQFCKREGIECTTNVNNVGFVEKDGKLIEALESGRPIILDEINRGKNQDFLLPYLDFLNGSYESMDIEAANGRVIHLTKDDIPDTFMLEAIGNPETLEMGIKEKMSEPLKDRFDVEYTEDYTAQDFTDMFCAYATGVPIAIIRDAFNIQDDEELSQVCKFLRTLGLSKEEREAVPEDQKLYLENAAQFLAAAEIVGKSLYELYQLKKECTNSNKCEDPKLKQHIKDTPFSFRLIEDIFNRVKTYVPQRGDKLKKNPFLQYAYEAPTGQNTLKMRMENQGEAIEAALKDVVKEIFWTEEADQKLAAPVLGFANNILSRNGVGDEEFFEARAISQSRLKNLFTFTAKKRVSDEALKIQEIICNIIKDAHTDLQNKSNDDLMDPTYIESYMADIRENQPEEHFLIGKVSSVNMSGNANNKTPFVETSVVETNGLIEDVSVENLVEAKAFLTTLAIDTLSENNIKTIWPKMFTTRESDLKDEDGNDVVDIFTGLPENVVDILSGRSEEVRYNSFMFKDSEDKRVVLDIVQNPEKNKEGTLIVGEELDKTTILRLKLKNIVYVDRNDPSAKKIIDNWMKGLPSSALSSLNIAVGLKNQIDGDVKSVSAEFVKPFDKRRKINGDQKELKTNLAQVTTYLPSELSEQGFGNGKKKAQINDVYEVLMRLQDMRGK